MKATPEIIKAAREFPRWKVIDEKNFIGLKAETRNWRQRYATT